MKAIARRQFRVSAKFDPQIDPQLVEQVCKETWGAGDHDKGEDVLHLPDPTSPAPDFGKWKPQKVVVERGAENSGVSRFPSLKPEELPIFGRKIQVKDNKWIEENVSSNPRYLVTSSDSPTILQEGFRYNALHIAARWGNHWAVQFILSTVSDAKFMAYLYPEDNMETTMNRIRYLCDMYLNTPDKAFNETPLMFACKFNWYDVVKLLVMHPLCDVDYRNTEDLSAFDLCGSRKEGDAKATRRVKALFQQYLIVPIWRDRNCTKQPIAGPPVDPRKLGQYVPKPFTEQFGNIVVKLYKEPEPSTLPENTFGVDWYISAFAGPLDCDTAQDVYEIFIYKENDMNRSSSSPSQNMSRRSISSPYSPSPLRPISSPYNSSNRVSLGSPYEISLTSPGTGSPYSPRFRAAADRKFRLGDPEKGIERVARTKAKEFNIKWTEYWDLFKRFLDFSSPEDLSIVNDYLIEMETLLENNIRRTILVNLCDDEKEDEFKDCVPYSVFLKGRNATTLDHQLYEAIKLVDENKVEKFEALYRWVNAMKALGSNTKSGCIRDILKGLQNLRIG